MGAVSRLFSSFLVCGRTVMLAVIMAILAWTGYAATFDVNSTDDAVDCNPGNGVAETAPGNGVCTLRAAIMEANALAGADVVNLPAGTYALTIAGTDEDACATGDLDITDALTVNGVGAGIEPTDTIVWGGRIDRVFHIVGTSTSGAFTGVYVAGAETSGSGGGLCNEGTAVLTGCAFSNNQASDGGGIHNGTGTVTVTYCTLEENTVTGHGGGLYNETGTVTLSNSTFWLNNNTTLGGTGDGGGLYVTGGAVAASNCTIEGNRADGYGGGICTTGGTTTLISCTLTGNAAHAEGDEGGHGICRIGGTVLVGNSIVADNIDWQVVPHADVLGVFTSLGHNFIGDGDSGTGFAHGVNGDQVGTCAAPLDPMLRQLKLYMGSTMTRAPLRESPVLDAGDLALLNHPAFAGSAAYDQRGPGHPRVFDGNENGTAVVDVGAFESTPSVFSVNSTVDAVDFNPGDGVAETQPGNGVCTLRAAIMEANALYGAPDTIFLPPGRYVLTIEGAPYDDLCVSGDLDILDDLTIYGADEATTIIDGDDKYRVLDAGPPEPGGPVADEVAISDLTVTNGKGPGSGGGMNGHSCSLSLTNCTFLANECRWDGSGGGLRGESTMFNCTFRDNISGGGGGGLCGGGTLTNCLFIGNRSRHGGGGMSGGGTITNCAFVSNESTLGYGGGLNGHSVVVTGCTFSGNTAELGGGYATGGAGPGPETDAFLTNCTFSGNHATNFGGGLYITDNTAVSGCTITGNVTDGTVANSVDPGVARGGGIYVTGYSLEPIFARCDVGNTIVAGNTATEAGTDLWLGNEYGSFASLGHNIIGDGNGSLVFVDGVNGDQIGTSGSAIDPRLGPLADNGGDTETHALLGGSPALDAGDNALITTPPYDGPPFYDQRGVGFDRICDGDHDGTATVDIGAFETPNGSAPTANGDAYAVDEGGTLVENAPGVLDNDTDSDGDPLTAVLATGPTRGSLNLGADGSFTYTHDGSETTSDSFTYRANDGVGPGNLATVTITVTPVNDAPVTAPDAYTVDEGGVLDVPAPGVRANDSDVEGDPLTAALGSNPAHGSLALNADGSFVYTHDGSETAIDTFTYRANDGAANGGPATVTITVNPVDDPLGDVALSSTTTSEGLPAGSAVGLLTGVDPDTGYPCTFALVDGPGCDDNGSFYIETSPSKSVAYLRTNECFLYEAKSSYSVRVRADDGHGGVVECVLVITVANVSADLDGDGASDTEEAAAGTDPFDTDNPTPILGVTPEVVDVVMQGGSATAVVMNEGRGTLVWETSVTGGSDWLAVAGTKSGTGAGSLMFTCAKNESGALRTGTVRVTSTNAVRSPVDVTIRQGACATLTPPGNVQASDGTQGALVILTWNAVAGASYEVFRGTDANFATAQSLGGTVNPYFQDATAALAAIASGCSGGTQSTAYHYWVVAFDACGRSQPSTPDTGYCGLAKKNVHEDALPAKAAGDGMQAAQLDSPLAIRLRSDEPIDPETVWGTIVCSSLETEWVTWQPISDTDGWVVFEPEDLWQFGETAVMTVGAATVSGEAVGPVTYTFQVESEDMLVARWDKDLDAVWQPGADDYAGMGMAPSSQSAAVALADDGAAPVLANGAGPACVIGPDRLFDAPQWVWMPVPDGVSASELGVFYFKAGGEGAGWHPADCVEGWLVPESCVQCECNGVEYLGFQALHGGVVQLAPADPAPAHPAGMLQGDILVFGLLVGALVLARGRASKKAESLK
jgi:CSLREA domain-containing protein